MDVDLYIHSPIRLHGVVLNYFSKETTLSSIYRAFSTQADWTLTPTSHKDTEQSIIEAYIILDGLTLTESLIR
jgi:hypothetical protein